MRGIHLADNLAHFLDLIREYLGGKETDDLMAYAQSILKVWWHAVTLFDLFLH